MSIGYACCADDLMQIKLHVEAKTCTISDHSRPTSADDVPKGALRASMDVKESHVAFPPFIFACISYLGFNAPSSNLLKLI